MRRSGIAVHRLFSSGHFLSSVFIRVLHYRAVRLSGPHKSSAAWHVPQSCSGHSSRQTLLHSFIVPKNTPFRKGVFVQKVAHIFRVVVCILTTMTNKAGFLGRFWVRFIVPRSAGWNDCPGTAASREPAFFWQQKKARKEKLPLFRRSGPATKGLHAPWIPKEEVAEGAG